MSMKNYIILFFLNLLFIFSSSSDEEINEVSTTKIKPQYVRTCTSELYYRRDEQVNIYLFYF
jgi:hypothetical protein